MHTYIADRALTQAGHGPWRLGPSLGLPWDRCMICMFVLEYQYVRFRACYSRDGLDVEYTFNFVR